MVKRVMARRILKRRILESHIQKESPLSSPPRRGRSYLSIAGLAGLTGALLAPLLAQPLAQAASPFGSEPVEAGRVIALAQPAGGDRWNLMVLEQREPAPPCWRRHADGTVTTYERNLPASTCGTYLSSSATSLRVGGEDLRHPWRLRVERRNGQLQLLAVGSQQPQPLLVGSAPDPGAAAPVELQLQDSWAFERRLYDGQRLSHLYVANANPLPLLLAQARTGGSLLAMPLPPPPPNPETPGLSSSRDRLARLEALRLGRRPGNSRTGGMDRFANRDEDLSSSGVIALQVVPYRP